MHRKYDIEHSVFCNVLSSNFVEKLIQLCLWNLCCSSILLEYKLIIKSCKYTSQSSGDVYMYHWKYLITQSCKCLTMIEFLIYLHLPKVPSQNNDKEKLNLNQSTQSFRSYKVKEMAYVLHSSLLHTDPFGEYLITCSLFQMECYSNS